MPQGMSQRARAVVGGASQRVNRDMGLLRSTKVGTALVSGVSRSVRATVSPVKRGGDGSAPEPDKTSGVGRRIVEPLTEEETDAQRDVFDGHVGRRLHRRPGWRLRLDGAGPRR